VLRRLTAAVALLALASMPMAARTRLICRYTGVELTDCAQAEIPESDAIQLEGCCDRQTTQAPGVLLIPQPPLPAPVVALPAEPSFAAPMGPPPPPCLHPSPPVFLITRSLLI